MKRIVTGTLLGLLSLPLCTAGTTEAAKATSWVRALASLPPDTPPRIAAQ
jgi:hypothetical protein